jgi:uncharacterized membrane protein
MKMSIPKLFVVLFTGFTFLFLSRVASSHEGHKKKKPVQTQTQTLPSSQTVGTTTMQSIQESGESDEKSSTTEPMRSKEEIMKEAIPAHIHNKIVHFPFALGIAGSIFLLISFKWPQYRSGARLLLILAAIAAIAAYFTGRAQEEPFEKGEMEPFLEAHKNSGIASAIFLWTGVLLTTWVENRTLLTIYALILLFLLSATGFFGGILAHG